MIRAIVPRYEEMVAHISEEVTRLECSKVLELGAGDGSIVSRLIGIQSVSKVVAVDYSTRVLEHLSNHYPHQIPERLIPIEGDVTSSQLWRNEHLQNCDAVIASLIFHDVPNNAQEEFFSNVARALRPGGILCFADPLDYDGRLAEHLHEWSKTCVLNKTDQESLKLEDPRMFAPMNLETLVQLAGHHGLRHVDRAQNPWRHLQFVIETFVRTSESTEVTHT